MVRIAWCVVNDEAVTLSEIQKRPARDPKIFQDFVGAERDRRVDERSSAGEGPHRPQVLYQVAKKEASSSKAR